MYRDGSTIIAPAWASLRQVRRMVINGKTSRAGKCKNALNIRAPEMEKPLHVVT